MVEVKAPACELPSEAGLPFSRFSCADITREAVRRGIVASISGRTVWRWLDADAIRPWLYRSWIFPHDERFAEKAGRVFWIGDNGSSHRGEASKQRIAKWHGNAIQVHQHKVTPGS